MKITVGPRDSLSAILKRYNVPGWNTPAVWNKLAPQLRSKNPNRIYAGEVIDLSPVLPQSQKSTPAPATPATPTASVTESRAVTEGTAATEGVPTKDWQEVMPWNEFFDENLALSSAAQRAAGYYTPMLQRGRENVESDFASRGLTRSSQRGKGVMDLYRDMAEKEQVMRDQLYGQREGEAKEDWGYQQGLYETDPRGYKATPYKTEKYEYDYPVESPGKYGKSYRDWLRSTFKI